MKSRRRQSILFLAVSLLCITLVFGCGKQSASVKSSDVSVAAKSQPGATPSTDPTTVPSTATPVGTVTTTLTARFLSVGEADSCIIRIDNAGNSFFSLIDTSRNSSGKVISELRAMGCSRIGVLVLTHPDADHTGGATSVMNAFPVDTVWYPETDGSNSQTWQGVKATIAEKQIPVGHPHAGDRFDWNGVSTTVLNPPSGATYTETNDWSIVLLESLGPQDLMLTGDAQTAAQQFMATESFSRIEAFKVPHHGANSGYYGGFVSKANPGNSIISVGSNSYGHPAANVIGALSTVGSVYRTDVNGDITVTETSGELRVTPTTGTAVDATQASQAASPAPAPAPAPSGSFVGSSKSDVYHYPSCTYAGRISSANLVTFSSPQDAASRGYRPCKVCHPPSP